jgi:hypothetical protein
MEPVLSSSPSRSHSLMAEIIFWSLNANSNFEMSGSIDSLALCVLLNYVNIYKSTCLNPGEMSVCRNHTSHYTSVQCSSPSIRCFIMYVHVFSCQDKEELGTTRNKYFLILSSINNANIDFAHVLF